MNQAQFPDFHLPAYFPEEDRTGEVKLSDFRGRWLVVYFYPRDNTPGCTKEALLFTEWLPKIHEQGNEVIGVSTQSVESHRKFAQKYGLKHILATDVSGKLASTLGILGLTGTAARTTYLINPEGFLVNDWKKVKVAGHVEEVLRAIEEQ